MSGLSGQAEIAITKPDGRVIRQVITNNIADAVFTQLQNRIKDTTGATAYHTNFMPTKIKTILANNAFLESPVTPTTSDLSVEYSIATATGSQFNTSGSGGAIDSPVSSVELLGESDEVIAQATTTNTTFKDSDVATDGSDDIDSDDKVDVSYTLKFQSASNLVTDYIKRLLATITEANTANDISYNKYELHDGAGLIVQRPELSVAGAVDNSATNDFLLNATAAFPKVVREPTIFKVKTSDGQENMSVNISGDSKLDDWIDGSNVNVPFRLTFARIVSVI